MHQPLMPPVTDAADQPDFVTALARGLAVIRAFGTQSKRLSLAEIARQVNLPRATVRRSLITLDTLGYVESDGKTFMLTPQVLSLGYSYLASMPVTRAVRPRLEKMSALLNEGSSAGILDHDDAVFVARVPVRHIVRESMTPGSRIPAFCTSMGRVLLAGQPDEMIQEYLLRIEPHSFTPKTITDPLKIHGEILAARQNAYSIVEEELDAGVLAISVPIKDSHDRTVAAIGVTSHVDRMTRDKMVDRFLPLMRDAVKEIRAELV
jgi:IclR family transcriptional regulator, pca regulon regulatory protein